VPVSALWWIPVVVLAVGAALIARAATAAAAEAREILDELDRFRALQPAVVRITSDAEVLTERAGEVVRGRLSKLRRR
jgi:hypothetical protein